MEIELSQLATGGAAVGIAWAVKEMLPYIVHRKKRDDDSEQCYRPDESWRQYCTQKFEGISDALTTLRMNDELLKSQLARLEIEVTKIGK